MDRRRPGRQGCCSGLGVFARLQPITSADEIGYGPPARIREGDAMIAARSVAAAAALALMLHTAAFAQVTTADIVGRVADASGAVLPGVTVTVVNTGTHDTRVAPTNASGDYTFTLLPIGRYSVKIELQGFTTQTASLALSAGDRSRLDVRLQVGAVEPRSVAGRQREDRK